jgi:hypothetical protein
MSASPLDARPAVAAPRPAAIAGVISSVLLIASLGRIRLAAPSDPTESGGWLTDADRRNSIRVALNLVPFAGIAFLWFVAVIRSHLRTQENQLLATVMFGSGLLFVACLFGAAALAGGLSDAVATGHVQLPDSETYYFGRHAIHALMNVYPESLGPRTIRCRLVVKSRIIFQSPERSCECAKLFRKSSNPCTNSSTSR